MKVLDHENKYGTLLPRGGVLLYQIGGIYSERKKTDDLKDVLGKTHLFCKNLD